MGRKKSPGRSAKFDEKNETAGSVTPYSRGSETQQTKTGKSRTKGKSQTEDEESVEYYDTEFEEASIGTQSREEEEYLDFLETYGNVDFTNLTFLPNLKTVDELQDQKKHKILTGNQMVRTQQLLNSNIDLNDKNQAYVIRPEKRKTAKQLRLEKIKAEKEAAKNKKEGDGSQQSLEQIEEEPAKLEESQRTQGSKKSKNSKQSEEVQPFTLGGAVQALKNKVLGEEEQEAGSEQVKEQDEEPPVEEIIKAQRFDHTYMETQYCHLLQIDEYGERITSKQIDYSRCVSIDCLEGPETPGEEEEGDEDAKSQMKTPSLKSVGDTPQPEIIPVEDLKNVYYFQWRVDRLQEDEVTPKIIIGICRDTLEVQTDLSRSLDSWAINLSTGDKFGRRRWKDYYTIEPNKKPKYGHFSEGATVGMLIDRDRGIINFFKDGNDLGQAFVDPIIKKGDYFPFIQTYCVCEISLFHPFVYPAYRAPVPFEDLSEEVCEDESCEKDDTICEIKEHGHKEPTIHRHKQHKEEENDWVPNVFAGIFGAENCGTDTRPTDSNRRKTSNKQSDGPQRSLICGADTRSKDNEEYKQAPLRVRRRKRSNSKYDDDEHLRSNRSKERSKESNHEKKHHKKNKEPSFQDEMSFEDKGYAKKSEHSQSSHLKQKKYDRQLHESKKQILKDMKQSEANMSLAGSSKRQVQINNMSIDLDDLDMKKLTHEQKKDIREIERLQHEVENLTGNLTMGEVSEIDRNFSMRPTVLSNSSQNHQIGNLQYEIEKYQKEIELLKLKLQFKHQIMSYKQMERQRNFEHQDTPNFQQDPCNIF